MPRNGSGIMSKPAGTTAVPNTVIESSKFNSVVDDIIQDLNDARPITAGGTGATSKSAARTELDLDKKVVYATKSTDYTAVADDNNAFLRFSATATLALTAAASLGVNWHITVFADGGDVTIDPNSSETINGATTLVVKSGRTVTVICTGTDFKVSQTIPGYSYAAKSSDYTALPSDNMTVFNCTAALTLSLTAAATLGAGWSCVVRANGGAVTIDPNSSETIDGAFTLVVRDGQTAFIFCTGSAFLSGVTGSKLTNAGSNGFYIIHGDGTLECWVKIDATSFNITTARGNLVGMSSSQTWTYPYTAGFSTAPVIEISVERNDLTVIVGANLLNAGGTSLTYNLWASGNLAAGNAKTVYIRAIGLAA